MIGEDKYNLIFEHIVYILLHLYSRPNVCRQLVQTIVDHMVHLITVLILPCLKSEIIRFLKSRNCAPDIITTVETIFVDYSNVFKDFLTEDKRFAIFATKGYLPPKSYAIGQQFVEKPGKDKLETDDKNGIRIPLKHSLQQFLKSPGVFPTLLKHIEDLNKNSNFISNIVHGSWFKDKFSSTFNDNNTIILPLTGYFDELTSGNALGSRALETKFGATYLTISCLPPSLASKLSSILFYSLVYAKDLKHCANKNVFKQLVDELNELSKEGLQFVFNNVTYTIVFQLGMFVGDNLGLNQIFDIVSSFKTDYCCRICKATKTEMEEMVKEDVSLLRDEKNYAHDVEIDDPEQTGIYRESVFNSIDNYHIAVNFTGDAMHDLLEGVMKYVLSNIIHHFLKKKNFTLEFLNLQIKNFKFNSFLNWNTPVEIKIDKKTGKPKLKMSAAEMLCFCHHFGLMVGGKIEDQDDYAWKLFKNLKCVLDIILLPRVTEATAKQLEFHVITMNTLYLELFGPLPPKFHFLVHYPRILLKFGPFIHFWCMRFESRHREIKAEANALSGNKNSLISIAIKESLRLCFNFNYSKIKENIIFGPEINYSFPAAVISSIDEDILNNAKFFDKIEVFEETFKIGTILVTENQLNKVVFGKILAILDSNNEIYVVLEQYIEDFFDDHLHAYNVKKNDKILTSLLNDLPDISACSMHDIKEQIYVTVPYLL